MGNPCPLPSVFPLPTRIVSIDVPSLRRIGKVVFKLKCDMMETRFDNQRANSDDF